MNAEGHELQILSGGAKLFANHLVRVAIVESARWHSATSDGCESMRQVVPLLDDGYHTRCLSGSVTSEGAATVLHRFDNREEWMRGCKALSRVDESGTKTFACRDIMFCLSSDCSFQ